MNSTFSLARLVAAVQREVGRWLAKCGVRRDVGSWRIAQTKRQMERALRDQGHSLPQARKLVAEHFRRHAN